MPKGFIKNEAIIEEKVSDTDYLDISNSVVTLSEKLTSADMTLMIGVVGPFGVGKSTLISQARQLRKDKSEEWIHFDAWQFPDRKELWDGLVLETAKYLSRLEETRRNMDGQSKNDKKLAISTVGSAVDLATTAIGLPAILRPIFGLIKNLEYFADESPARRVFEIQEIFTALINKTDKEKVVFVLEDVDRSGESGLFFLETFRQFLSNNQLTKKVVVIVTVSNSNFNKNIDSYLKCFDFVEFFGKKNQVNLTQFITELYETDVQNELETLVDFFNYFYSEHMDINMRKIKLILRQANLNYIELTRAGYQPNRLVCIAAVAAKYLVQDEKEGVTYYDYIIKHNRIPANNEISRMILLANPKYRSYSNEHITTTSSNGKELSNTLEIRLIKREDPSNVKAYPSIPYTAEFWRTEEPSEQICLPDFYFLDL